MKKMKRTYVFCASRWRGICEKNLGGPLFLFTSLLLEAGQLNGNGNMGLYVW